MFDGLIRYSVGFCCADLGAQYGLGTDDREDGLELNMN